VISQQRDHLEYGSDAVALALTGLAATLFLATSAELFRRLPVESMVDHDRGIELTVNSAEPRPPQAVPVPPPPVPRRAHQTRTARAQAVPVDPTPVAQGPVPPEAEAFVAADPSPAIAPSNETHTDQDAQYAAQLRADIDRRTHPPDSPEYRLHHPAGEARVQFVVARSGETRGVLLLRSSGSTILDQAAVDTVRSGHYPPMPVGTFAGEPEHVFVVTMEYRRMALALRTP
jgi:periplasmic protein TonB